MRKICKILGFSKSTYYYQTNKYSKSNVNNYKDEVISAFKQNRSIYGARKIKAVLAKQNITISRKKIRQIMLENNLVSKYTKLKY